MELQIAYGGTGEGFPEALGPEGSGADQSGGIFEHSLPIFRQFRNTMHTMISITSKNYMGYTVATLNQPYQSVSTWLK